MKKILFCLLASVLFLNVNVNSASGFDLNSEEDVNKLRKKIFGGLDVSLNGVGGIEATLENKFGELTGIGGRSASTAADETFYDFRSYFTTKIKKNEVSLVLSVDVAGDDFSDPAGAVLGNSIDDTSTAGGPAVTRDTDWDLRVRHLYLNYDGRVKFAAGRLPAKIGHGIMVHTIRDSARLIVPFKPFVFGGVLVKGGETFPNSVTSDSLGENDNDLDAYLVFGKYKRENFAATLSYVIQDDSRKDNGFPEKQYINLSVDGSKENLSYQLEGIYFGGKSSFNSTNGQRLDNDAWMGYGKVTYRLPDFHSKIGAAVGYGSGDNNSSDNTQSDYQSLFMDNNGFQIANIYGNDIHGYDSYRAGTTGSDGNNAGAGFANTTFFQISAFKQLTDRLDIDGSFTYMIASKKQLVGEGVLLHANDGSSTAGETRKSDDIGWEADANLAYKITDAVTFYSRFGFFHSGNIWGDSVPDAKKAQGGFLFVF